MQQTIDIEALCAERGLRITDQRRVIAKVLSESTDHPDVEKLHERAVAVEPRISIATVYRTVRLFEEAGILDRHDFGDGRARYEAAPEAHHDHLIDVETGEFKEDHEIKGNLAAANPETVQRLTQLAEKYISDGRSTPGAKQENNGETFLYPAWLRKQGPKK